MGCFLLLCCFVFGSEFSQLFTPLVKKTSTTQWAEWLNVTELCELG